MLIPTRQDLLRLRALIEPVAEGLGCELVAVEMLGKELRISIDRPGGVGIQECTKVSRTLSPVLDVEDVVPGPYELVVSTPGIERPLQRVEDFARFAGCEVRIKVFGAEARKRVRGVLGGVDGQDVLVTTAEGPQRLPLPSIERAHLALTMEQFARLGQGLHPIESGEST